MLASQQPVWRGRPLGSWREEEAARERLRNHRRRLKHARPAIKLEYKAPLPRRPLRLPGLPAPLLGGKARQRRVGPRRDAGRRAFVPLLQPIDEIPTAQAAAGLGAVSSVASLPHYGPAPPAYRPSPELVAAIVKIRTEELEEALGKLRQHRAEDADKRIQEKHAAKRAVAQAETWDASAEVCMRW